MESVVRCSNTGSFAVDTKISKRFASAVNHDVLQEGHQLKDLCGWSSGLLRVAYEAEVNVFAATYGALHHHMYD